MAKYVMAAFSTVDEAKDYVKALETSGYPRESLSVMADETMVANLDDVGVMVERDAYHYDTADRGAWSRIKDFFSGEDRAEEQEREDTAYYGHQQQLRGGEVLVLVDCDMVPDDMQGNAQASDDSYWADARQTATDTPDEQTIRLMEERLNVDKQNVATGEVTIKKHVVQQNETIEVPVTHEELVVERHAVSGEAGAGNDQDFGEETITIPLTEEQVHVTKEPVVVEEVQVKKRSVTDNKQVSDTVRREELDVDKAGNVVMGNPQQMDNANAP